MNQQEISRPFLYSLQEILRHRGMERQRARCSSKGSLCLENAGPTRAVLLPSLGGRLGLCGAGAEASPITVNASSDAPGKQEIASSFYTPRLRCPSQ